MTDALIWRDAHDPDQFYLGIEWKCHGKTFKRMWVAVHIDGLDDLFDMSSEDLKAIGTAPVPIKLEMFLRPHESLVPPEAPATEEK